MDAAILTAATERCGSKVRYVEFVEVGYQENMKKVFFCVACHSCCLLRKSFSRVVTGAVFNFSHIDKFVVDKNSASILMIKFTANRPSYWTSDRIYITSQQRTELLKHLEVAWSTDYMYRHGRAKKIPLFEDGIPRKKGGDFYEYPKVEPFLGFQEVHYNGYFFYLDDSFEDRATASGSSGTGQYVDPRRIEVAIHMHDPILLNDLEEIGRDSLRYVAAEYKQGFTENVKHFSVVDNKPYPKKMNLSDDIAAWSRWDLTVYTEEALICCVLLRRSYIPPLLDMCQDIAVIFRMRHEDMSNNKMTLHALQRECHLAADSISTVTQNHVWYKEFVQYKLDALLYNEDSYMWLDVRLKIRPSYHNDVKAVLKSILTLFHNETILANLDLLSDLDPSDSIPVIKDPIAAINLIVQNPNGFDPADDSELQIMKRNEWAMRTARYVGYCINGGLLPGKFGMQDMAAAVGKMKPASNRKLHAVMEFILHMRPADFRLPFESGSLAKKLEDISGGVTTEICNATVLASLFETQYIAKLFPKGREATYVQLMGLLLMSPTTTTNLKISMCRQILQASNNPTARQEFFDGIVPAIVSLVKPSSQMYSPIVATYAIAALVNLSAANDVIKTLLLNSGIAPVVVNQLRAKDDELVGLSVKLAINLTKQTTQRHRFISSGIVPALVDLLSSDYDTPHDHKFKEFAEQVALIGQLANDVDARDALLSKYPVLEIVLYFFHKAPTDSDLKLKSMFCLRQLSMKGWQFRQRIGKHVIPPIVTCLREATDGAFLVTALTLLQQLALFKPNCVDMRQEGIEEAVGQLVERMKIDTIVDRGVSLIETVKTHCKWLDWQD